MLRPNFEVFKLADQWRHIYVRKDVSKCSRRKLWKFLTGWSVTSDLCKSEWTYQNAHAKLWRFLNWLISDVTFMSERTSYQNAHAKLWKF